MAPAGCFSDGPTRLLIALAQVRLGSDTRTCRVAADILVSDPDAAGRAETFFERVLDGLGLSGPARSAVVERAVNAAARAEQASAVLGLHVLTRFDERYPAWLATIPDPPLCLWARGSVSDLVDPHAVAIVGSRNGTPTGCAVAERLARQLAGEGVLVVSGLARGIDAAAHRGALAGGGRTLAVVGHGLDRIYPTEHGRLAEQIVGAGALVSEFPPGYAPVPRHFPLRNRVISGLSRAVVVVEASDRSGSLITARAALEQGREVLAVPGNVASGCYKGSHALIKDGARLVETVDDILEELHWARSRSQPLGESGKYKQVNWLLSAFPPGSIALIDDLVRETGRPAAEVVAELGLLEIAGKVVRAGLGGFRRLDEPATY